MKPININEIQTSFTIQAKKFEDSNMNFSKQKYLDYTVHNIEPSPQDYVLETAAGTCACGRAIAPFVESVTCLDATPAMLEIGQKEADKSGLHNIKFVNGFVEKIPFPDKRFDIVLTRLAFHHFTKIERPFAEMSRVLKPGGKLVIIDMEATEEVLRKTEDRIERMRDPSHVRNLSKEEFVQLFQNHEYTITKEESTRISVSLKAWLALTNTPEETSKEIITLMEEDIQGGKPTGFAPYIKDDEIHFEQRWLMMIGVK